MKLIATAAFGLEAIVADELKGLGYENLRVENSRVYFEGDIKDICRCNLWLRTADRIQINLAEFKALSFEELFEGTKQIPWEDFIGVNDCFPVTGKSVKSKLFSVPDCQAIVKKAIVERLKNKYQTSWFKEDGPMVKIQVSILKDIATLTIDTTGAGLHKRGYRAAAGPAPLKETIAAALLNISYWKPDRPLIDPMCGSGTIPIEAALIARNVAPGLYRSFAFQEWGWVSPDIIKEAKAEAHSLVDYDTEFNIKGFDISNKAIKFSQFHAEEAGVDDIVTFEQCDIANLKTEDEYGCIICNPPYGERLSDEEEIEQLYASMASTFKALDTWSTYVITSNKGMERHMGKKANKRRKLYNGNIECQYYQFFGPPPGRKGER